MNKLSVLLFCAASLAFGQDYKLETISTPAPGLPAAYAAEIQPQGYRVNGPSGPWCEIWFRKAIPEGPKPTDPAVALPIAQGTLIAVLRFPKEGADRRGQMLKPGLYTLRYSNFPSDGAHQGIAPQRDFALATPIANDPDPKAMPEFDKLVAQSKTGGTPHAEVFSLEPPSGSTFPALAKEGEHDFALSVKVGDLPIGIILVGKAE